MNPRWTGRLRGRIAVALLVLAKPYFEGIPAAGAERLAGPTRATIERHVDASITVHGRFAAVRLPVTRGVALWNPTAVKVAGDGSVFVANYTGEILRVTDTDGDGLEDTALAFADVRKDGLRYPTSLALRGREVFVGAAQAIQVYEDTDGDGVADRSRVFCRDFPCSEHTFDWVFGLAFDREGRLNFALSTDSYNPAPAADPAGMRGAVLRVQPDGSGLERLATGLRFPYGMAMNEVGELFFTDNKGGGNPTEEVNRLVAGAFYGHHPEKFPGHGPATPPLVAIHYGFGMVGMAFNPGTNDFGGTAGDMFVASWGPDFRWERGSISRVRLDRQADGSYRAQEFPFAHEVPKLGDLAFGSGGDLYAAQFGREGMGHIPYPKPSGGLYRFIHAPWYEPPPGKPPHPVIAGDRENGRRLFESLGCNACHTVGGGREMLGPDLAGIGEMFSEEEVLVAIRKPSEGIKSGHEAVEIDVRDAEPVVGRVLRADEEAVVILQAGGLEQVIPRTKVQGHRALTLSLMPEGLLNSCAPRDVDDLLAYLGVRRPVAWVRLKESIVTGVREWRAGTTRGAKVAAAAGLLVVVGSLGGLVLRAMRRRR